MVPGKHIRDVAWGDSVVVLTCKSPFILAPSNHSQSDDGELYSWVDSPEQAMRVTCFPPGVKRLFSDAGCFCYLVY